MIVALHTAKKGCQLFILDTEIMDKDMDMERVLPSGNGTYFIFMDLRVTIIDWPGSHRPMGVPRSTCFRAPTGVCALALEAKSSRQWSSLRSCSNNENGNEHDIICMDMNCGFMINEARYCLCMTFQMDMTLDVLCEWYWGNMLSFMKSIWLWHCYLYPIDFLCSFMDCIIWYWCDCQMNDGSM